MLPTDFDSLVQDYGDVIQAEGVAPGLLLSTAGMLMQRGVLDFDLPPLPKTISLQELCDMVGLTITQWRTFLRRKSPHTPTPLQGTPGSKLAVFRLEDGLRMKDERATIWPRISKRGGLMPPVMPGEIPAFRLHLQRETKIVKDNLKAGRYDNVFAIPAHLPSTYEELVERYGDKKRGLVMNEIRKRVKYNLDHPDVYSDIWLKIIDKKFITKFIASGATKLPAKITAEEAVAFLGVDWRAWGRMLSRGVQTEEGQFYLEPVKGDLRDKQAQFRSVDILKLDRSGYFKSRPYPRMLPEAAVSSKRLALYLKAAVGNYCRNEIRYHVRHFSKDTLLDPNAVLSEAGDSFKPHSSDEDSSGRYSGWQDSVPAPELDTEQALDAVRLAECLEVEAGSEEYYDRVEALTQEVRRRDLSGEDAQSVLNLLAKGCSMSEALRKNSRMVHRRQISTV